MPLVAGPRLERRAVLRSAAGGLLLAAGGCGGDERRVAAPTATSVPPTPAPTATQAAIASPVPGYIDPQRWAGRVVTVASQGGEYQDAQATAIFEPFAIATGAEVQQRAVDLGELRQQIEQGSVTWDLVDIPTEEVLPLAHNNYLTPIDYQVVDRTPLFEEIVMQHAVGAAFFSSIIGYRADTVPAPRGWADFWDVASHTGARALRRGPVGTLEFALLADGVLPTELYPLDVERAFASLERIKPHVAQWYDNAKQPIALILSGDVSMASTYNVQAEMDEARTAVALQWRGGMLSADSWVLPRDAPNHDVAMDLINFATRAIPCANFARLVPFGPVNRNAFASLRPDRLALLPNTPEHGAVQFLQNWNWWADNREELTERFDDWLLQEPKSQGGTPEAM